MDVPRATSQLWRDGGYDGLVLYTSLVPSRLSGPWYEHHDGHHEAHVCIYLPIVWTGLCMYVCTWPIMIVPVENFLEDVSIILDYDETVVAFHHQAGLLGKLFKEVVPLQAH